MCSLAIDTLGYVRILEEAGFTRQQAEAQATIMCQQAEAQAAAMREQADTLQKAFEKHNESSRYELATKGDVLDVRPEIEKVRAEIEKIRTEAKQAELRLLKWQLAGWVALAAIMAKGFNWIGF